MTDAADSTSVLTMDAAAPRAASARPLVDLFLISFLILFLELVCIRWFGSIVIFLTFFTNIVLMACFLGVSFGCLSAARRWSWMSSFIPVALLATASASGFLWAYERFGEIMIDVGSQQSPQLIYFGTESRVKDPSKWVVPIELLAGCFFMLNALLFVGPGQEIGRRFAVIENRMMAYTADILGSLAGIAVFALMSFYRLPAILWFAIALTLGVYFVPRRRGLHSMAGLSTLVLVAWADYPRNARGEATEIIWSAYYQVRFTPRLGSIDVNNVTHQVMLKSDVFHPGYFLPHFLNRTAGGKPFDDVLVIGAGSGNDVAAALVQGATHVDAVEIDPVLYELGRLHHPNKPYSSPRVSIHLDDGRSFLRKTQSRYDLISYALVDSLALHSSYASVRLESFLFTDEAFREIKAKLKPGGVFVMYNAFRQGWLVGRLVKMAERVFGSRPIVVSYPFRASINPDDNLRDQVSLLMVGEGDSNAAESIRAKFAAGGPLFLDGQAASGTDSGRAGSTDSATSRVPAPVSLKIGPAEVEPAPDDRIPTDDWPFLYLRNSAIPALNLRGMAVVAVLSVLSLIAFAPIRRPVRPSARMFFLGAGFMLLETKGVVHMALLFGSTWVVNSIVFSAILFMVLLSNLYVMAVRPKRLWPYYLVLLAALLINLIVPMNAYLGLPGMSKVIASCLVVYLPVFFAGVIFATAFRSSVRPDVDFGSNLGGIILGGLSEYLSLIFGFNALIGVAMGYYALSALMGRKDAIPTGVL